MTPSANGCVGDLEVICFQIYNFCAILITTTSQMFNGKQHLVVQECYRLLLHVREPFPKKNSFRRSQRVLPKSFMIAGSDIGSDCECRIVDVLACRATESGVLYHTPVHLFWRMHRMHRLVHTDFTNFK